MPGIRAHSVTAFGHTFLHDGPFVHRRPLDLAADPLGSENDGPAGTRASAAAQPFRSVVGYAAVPDAPAGGAAVRYARPIMLFGHRASSVALVLTLAGGAGCSSADGAAATADDAAVAGDASAAEEGADAAASDGTASTEDASAADDASDARRSDAAPQPDAGSGDTAAAADAADATTKPDATSADTAAPKPTCGPKAVAGDYCGNDEMVNADPGTLYTCSGPNVAPTKAVVCAAGCQVQAAGTNDVCKTPTTPNSYRLPWTHGVSMQLTQDCNDACCADHVGNDEYAWDFANGSSFVVRAARAGTITHFKLSSSTGCGTSTCANDANMIVVDHGDGTQAIYMHLAHASAQGGLTCGAKVTQGQPLAMAGTTGWSTGIHLHFQVSQVHAGAPTCECGADGLGCADTWNPYTSTWVNATYKTVAIAFDEWAAASACANRRITMPQSLN
jgi:hypothetical protein